jgi:hypothetical protein
MDSTDLSALWRMMACAHAQQVAATRSATVATKVGRRSIMMISLNTAFERLCASLSRVRGSAYVLQSFAENVSFMASFTGIPTSDAIVSRRGAHCQGKIRGRTQKNAKKSCEKRQYADECRIL